MLTGVFNVILHEDPDDVPVAGCEVVGSPRLIIRSRVDLDIFIVGASFLVTLATLMPALCSACARRCH